MHTVQDIVASRELIGRWKIGKCPSKTACITGASPQPHRSHKISTGSENKTMRPCAAQSISYWILWRKVPIASMKPRYSSTQSFGRLRGHKHNSYRHYLSRHQFDKKAGSERIIVVHSSSRTMGARHLITGSSATPRLHRAMAKTRNHANCAHATTLASSATIESSMAATSTITI